jgi:hypothetical protein
MDPASTGDYLWPVDHGPASDDTRLLLRLIVAGQERERRHWGDVFHDGPIQDLTAVLLGCAAVRRGLPEPEAEKLAVIETQLRDAMSALHLPAPAFRVGNDARTILESALASRVRGPLTRDLDVVLELDEPGPTRAELAELLAAVQLLLSEADPRRPALAASVTIRAREDGVALTLRAAPDPRAAAGPDAAADAAARTERFARLATILGAQITEDEPGGAWCAALSWPCEPTRRARVPQAGKS